MPRNRRHLHRIEALLKQPEGRFMAQVMERQPLDACRLADPLKGLGD